MPNSFQIILVAILIISCLIEAKEGGGVYYYRNKKTNKVHYVGQTNNFYRRDAEHKKDNRYFTSKNYRMDKFHIPNSTPQERSQIEKYYINKYDPPANKKCLMCSG